MGVSPQSSQEICVDILYASFSLSFFVLITKEMKQDKGVAAI
jgi:hypothetical protein